MRPPEAGRLIPPFGDGNGSGVRPALGTRPRILLVEDDAVLAGATAMILGTSFEILVATTGRGALEVLADDTIGLDLVVSDVGLPDIASHRLRNELIQLRGDLPTVWISGHDRAEVARRLGATPRHFLMKPYSLDQLEAAVREALQASSVTRREAERGSGTARLRGSGGRSG